LPTQISQAPTNHAARGRNLKCVATFAHVADSPTEGEILPAVTSRDPYEQRVARDNCENSRGRLSGCSHRRGWCCSV